MTYYHSPLFWTILLGQISLLIFLILQIRKDPQRGAFFFLIAPIFVALSLGYLMDWWIRSSSFPIEWKLFIQLLLTSAGIFILLILRKRSKYPNSP